MSAKNGDKARFQKDRKRKLVQRQRMRELRRPLTAGPDASAQPGKKAPE